MHVYVPLEADYDYARIRRFVDGVGRLLVAANPEDLTMEWDKPKRRGRCSSTSTATPRDRPSPRSTRFGPSPGTGFGADHLGRGG